MKKLIVLACCLLTCSGKPVTEQVAYQEIQQEAQVEYYEAVPLQMTPVNFEKGNMVKDIVNVWQMFFKDGKAPADDPRRKNFIPLAEEVADWIIYFQNNDVKEIGGRLPKHPSVPIMIAYIVTQESSVDPMALGYKYNEVGLFQVWGVALAGFDWMEVRDNSNLGAMLGVRWIAHSVYQCNKDLTNWRDSDWLGVLTVYGAGPKAIEEGRCQVYEFARKRYVGMNFYQMRLEMSKQKFTTL
jgi:hypothetical protein